MKRTKIKRKVMAITLSLALAVTATLSMSLTVFAEPLTYHDTGVYDADHTTATQNLVGGPESNQIKGDVKARITGGSIDYFISVEFGNLEYTYNYGPQWDAVNHQYISTDAAGWYYDGITSENCHIDVKNYSNFPVLADFSYENDKFNFNNNPLPVNKYAVGGVFNTSVNDLKDLVRQNLVDPATQSIPTMKLRSCDESRRVGLPYYYTSDDGDLSSSGTLYFALMGTPDAGIDTLGSITPVGTITVTITPANGVLVGTYSAP